MSYPEIDRLIDMLDQPVDSDTMPKGSGWQYRLAYPEYPNWGSNPAITVLVGDANKVTKRLQSINGDTRLHEVFFSYTKLSRRLVVKSQWEEL